MIDSFKIWITNISTTVLFITAVEMLLPNNKMKKYAKFVLGLILITVLINPIIKIFDNNFDIAVYANKASQYIENKNFETDLDKYKEEGKAATINTFKLNLENECEKKLKETYPKNTYKVSAEINYDKDQNLTIKDLKIGVKDNNVERVKKVEISTKGNLGNTNNVLEEDRARKIKDYLSKEFKIPNDAIVVYKL